VDTPVSDLSKLKPIIPPSYRFRSSVERQICYTPEAANIGDFCTIMKLWYDATFHRNFQIATSAVVGGFQAEFLVEHSFPGSDITVYGAPSKQLAKNYLCEVALREINTTSVTNLLTVRSMSAVELSGQLKIPKQLVNAILYKLEGLSVTEIERKDGDRPIWRMKKKKEEIPTAVTNTAGVVANTTSRVDQGYELLLVNYKFSERNKKIIDLIERLAELCLESNPKD